MIRYPSYTSQHDATVTNYTIQVQLGYMIHTSLGEEGTEAVVGISGLALIGQVTIRLSTRQSVHDIHKQFLRKFMGWTNLNTVFKAVKLNRQIVSRVNPLHVMSCRNSSIGISDAGNEWQRTSMNELIMFKITFRDCPARI